MQLNCPLKRTELGELLFVTQCQTYGFDFLCRALAQVGDGAVFDLAIFAIGFAQEVSGIGFPFASNSGDVHVHCGYGL